MKKIISISFITMLFVGCAEDPGECIDRKEASFTKTCLRACEVSPIDMKCGQEYIGGSVSGFCVSDMKAKPFGERVEECKESCSIPWDQMEEIIDSCY
tara:strand:- start:934 stop:1227 length:294 start_codon:yes stop_codon:yes gene_type:complete